MGIDVAPLHTAAHRKSIRFPFATKLAGSDIAEVLSPAAHALSTTALLLLQVPLSAIKLVVRLLKFGLRRPFSRFLFRSTFRDCRISSAFPSRSVTHAQSQPHPRNRRPATGDLLPNHNNNCTPFLTLRQSQQRPGPVARPSLHRFQTFATATAAPATSVAHYRHRPVFIRDSLADSCARRLLCPCIQQKPEHCPIATAHCGVRLLPVVSSIPFLSSLMSSTCC